MFEKKITISQLKTACENASSLIYEDINSMPDESAEELTQKYKAIRDARSALHGMNTLCDQFVMIMDDKSDESWRHCLSEVFWRLHDDRMEIQKKYNALKPDSSMSGPGLNQKN
jgi:hypothetical protein